jgi:hypothetical protein
MAVTHWKYCFRVIVTCKNYLSLSQLSVRFLWWLARLPAFTYRFLRFLIAPLPCITLLFRKKNQSKRRRDLTRRRKTDAERRDFFCPDADTGFRIKLGRNSTRRRETDACRPDANEIPTRALSPGTPHDTMLENRREAYRHDANTRFRIKGRGASGRHSIWRRQLSTERRGAYCPNADTRFGIKSRCASGCRTTQHWQLDAERRDGDARYRVMHTRGSGRHTRRHWQPNAESREVVCCQHFLLAL